MKKLNFANIFLTFFFADFGVEKIKKKLYNKIIRIIKK